MWWTPLGCVRRFQPNTLPEDKNNTNTNFHADDTTIFNDSINSLNPIEILLLGSTYTWSSQRTSPTLVYLDRVFLNDVWDLICPKTSLSILTRYISDHTPLLIIISSCFMEFVVASWQSSSHAFIEKHFISCPWVGARPSYFPKISCCWACHSS
jgi:hypothetical protein